MSIIRTLALLSLLAFASTVAADGLATKPVLSIELAEKIALGCQAYATDKGWRMNIAVVNDSGLLTYFRRHSESYRGSVELSINKAYTVTQFSGTSTRNLGVFVENNPALATMPRLMTLPGGLAISAQGKMIGAIGVSGGTADQDEECANAGIDSAADMLK